METNSMAMNVCEPENRIAIVICYFGHWPQWINYFLLSCQYNSHIQFLIFSDCGTATYLKVQNVAIVPFSLDEFNVLASEKLKVHIQVTDHYKLCDYKPAYGVIFSDWLRSFTHWAHSDLDLIFGDLKKFLTNDLLSSFDVVTAKKHYLVGHFTLYKNRKDINRLYELSKDHYQVFTNGKKVYSFDECNYLWYELLLNIPLEKLKCEIESMTHVVAMALKRGKIKAAMYDMVIEQDEVEILPTGVRLRPFERTVQWCQGKISTSSNREFLYFHFHFLKKNPRFRIMDYRDGLQSFQISENGFSF
jgi:hypothetical protein